MYEKPVEDLLEASGVDLSLEGGFEELEQFQEYLTNYKIVLFYGLKPHRIMFSGNSLYDKKLYLLYNSDTRHYNVFTLRLLRQKRACVTRVTPYTTIHKCDKACSLCTVMPPCTKDQTKYCACNTWYLGDKYFQNHLTHKVKGKLVCQWRQVCRNCSFLVTDNRKQIYYLQQSRPYADKICYFTQLSWIRRTIFAAQVFGTEIVP